MGDGEYGQIDAEEEDAWHEHSYYRKADDIEIEMSFDPCLRMGHVVERYVVPADAVSIERVIATCVDLGMPFDVTKELEARLRAPTENEKE